MPILAEDAVEIASFCAEAEDRLAREEVIKGFFFDGVHRGGGDFAVNEAYKLAAGIPANAAETDLVGLEPAELRAELAAQDIIVEFTVTESLLFHEKPPESVKDYFFKRLLTSLRNSPTSLN